MLKDQLFGDFQGFSKTEWKQKIEADLKGRTYESLCTTNSSGISIEPVYIPEDIDIKDDSPESGSYRRGSKRILTIGQSMKFLRLQAIQ